MENSEETIEMTEVVAVEGDTDLFKFPEDDDVSDMLDEIAFDERLPTVTERYFTPYYKLDIQKPGDDLCIRVHSNRICMLTLAPSHPILRERREISAINFKVSDKLDRTKNNVSGKSKHGAQPLQSNSNICSITCKDGETFMVKCCMVGKLVEVNELLSERPQLLHEPPHRGGYIAIVLPNINLLDKIKESLLSQETYDLLMSQRCETNNVNSSSENCRKRNLESADERAEKKKC